MPTSLSWVFASLTKGKMQAILLQHLKFFLIGKFDPKSSIRGLELVYRDPLEMNKPQL